MVYMYHSFLIHSSADGHLGCFHVLAMINSAAMNIGVHVSRAPQDFIILASSTPPLTILYFLKFVSSPLFLTGIFKRNQTI